MGTYINIGNAGFQRSRNSEYVDKSSLIALVNNTLFAERQFSCVTRCRRFILPKVAEYTGELLLVGKHLASSKQALSILLEQLRSRQGAA